MTVHSLPLAVVDERRAAPGRAACRWRLILLVCAAPVIASYWLFYVARPGGGEAAYGDLIAARGRACPTWPPSTCKVAAVPLRALKGQWLLVVVGPAACDVGLRAAPVPAAPVARDAGPRTRPRRQGLADHRRRAAQARRCSRRWRRRRPCRCCACRALRCTAWLKPATGHALEDHLYLVDPMGEWMMRMPADARSGQGQARPRTVAARVGLLGHAGTLTAMHRNVPRRRHGARAARCWRMAPPCWPAAVLALVVVAACGAPRRWHGDASRWPR